MIKVKKLNYFLLFLLITTCWLFITGLAQSQTSQINITLTWSTDTYVQAGYQGKALPVRGSNIEVVANIDDKINSENLVYNWFVNDYFKKESSGLNKQVLKFNTDITTHDKNAIRLEIKNTNGIFLGVSYLTIETRKPKIVIHTKKGLLESNNYKIKGNQEVQFIAKPYFFNIDNINELNYRWGFNEQKASRIDENNPNILTFKINELTESIKQNLSISVENKNNKIQRAQKTIEITLIP